MIQATDLRRLILSHPLIHHLDAASQERMLAATQESSHDNGALLIRQGQEADRFFMVLKGRVKLFRISADGQEKVVEIIHPGQTFAEAVVFMQKHLLGHMSVRLHQRLGELETLTLQNATQRFALFLIQRLDDRSVESATIDLQLPKRLIAARLSMQPESLSRLMARLRTAGLIEINGRVIRIPSVGRLLAEFGDNGSHSTSDNVSASNAATDNSANAPRMITIRSL